MNNSQSFFLLRTKMCDNHVWCAGNCTKHVLSGMGLSGTVLSGTDSIQNFMQGENNKNNVFFSYTERKLCGRTCSQTEAETRNASKVRSKKEGRGEEEEEEEDEHEDEDEIAGDSR